MKFLVIPSFAAINSVLNKFDNGESIILGRVEGYSCKAAGADKKLFKTLNTSLEQQLNAPPGSDPHGPSLGTSLGSSFDDSSAALEKLISPHHLSPTASSPFGPLSDQHSRRTFISLIQVLNASFPDYDFSELAPEDFRREDLTAVRANVTRLLPAHALEAGAPLTARLWQALEAELRVSECDVYSYQPTDSDRDPFSEHHTLWYFNYFFYNRRLRRVAFFTCRAISKLVLASVKPDEVLSDDDGRDEVAGFDEQVFDEMES